ncbi:MAG: DUF1015 family protein [Saprospiraceae bacterium]
MEIQPITAIFTSKQTIAESVQFLEQIKYDYPAWEAQGFFQNATSPAMYVYRIHQKSGNSQLGLVAGVSLDDYITEHIKRHEHTLVAKEVRQAALLKERGAVVKPVLLAHRYHTGLADKLSAIANSAPLQTITLEDIEEEHSFWKIDDEETIRQLREWFAKEITIAYIADGHHRFSSVARLYQQLSSTGAYNPYTHLICAIFPGRALRIHNFNRAVSIFENGLTPLAFMAHLSEFAHIKPMENPQQPTLPHTLTMYLRQEWFELTWKNETLMNSLEEGLPSMDVSMLNYYVLQQIGGVEDVRNDERIHYVEGPQGLGALAEISNKHNAVGFCLHPLSWDAFSKVIDHGLVLPPKSTWFEPRMKNGLIIQKMDA